MTLSQSGNRPGAQPGRPVPGASAGLSGLGNRRGSVERCSAGLCSGPTQSAGSFGEFDYGVGKGTDEMMAKWAQSSLHLLALRGTVGQPDGPCSASGFCLLPFRRMVEPVLWRLGRLSLDNLSLVLGGGRLLNPGPSRLSRPLPSDTPIEPEGPGATRCLLNLGHQTVLKQPGRVQWPQDWNRHAPCQQDSPAKQDQGYNTSQTAGHGFPPFAKGGSKLSRSWLQLSKCFTHESSRAW